MVSEKHLPRPEEMKAEAYKRNIAARAFDVARYCLFFGIPTGVGQVVSIRTLEKQVRRLKASPYQELRELGDEIASSCAKPATCDMERPRIPADPVAPTLTKFVDADEHPAQCQGERSTVGEAKSTDATPTRNTKMSRYFVPADTLTDAVACSALRSDGPLVSRAVRNGLGGWSYARRMEVIDVALESRTRRDEMLRAFPRRTLCLSTSSWILAPTATCIDTGVACNCGRITVYSSGTRFRNPPSCRLRGCRTGK